MATKLLQQFYIYWQTHDNHVVLTLSLKYYSIFFRWNIFKRPNSYSGLWRKGKPMTHTHTHTETHQFWSRQKHILKKRIWIHSSMRILPVFPKFKSKAYRWTYSKDIHRMPPPSLCLNASSGTCSGGRMYRQTLISSSCLHLLPFKVCLYDMTYDSERRYTKQQWEKG